MRKLSENEKNKLFDELDRSAEEVRDMLVNALNDYGGFDLVLPDHEYAHQATARLTNGRLFIFSVRDAGDIDEVVFDQYIEGEVAE